MLLRGVDRAAFAVALAARLRNAGVAVSASGPGEFVAAMQFVSLDSRSQVYWAARLTLVDRAEELAAFDAVFDAIFGDASFALQPEARRHGVAGGPGAWAPAGRIGEVASSVEGGGLPWLTRPAAVLPAEPDDAGVVLPDVLPSALAARADAPFDAFDEAELRALGLWLERAAASWPRRRAMRRVASRHGRRVDVRKTIAASRSTGWEPLFLARSLPRQRPRSLVLICDVSRSMQPYASVYLHLMRAAALRRQGVRPEVFAFATSLTRLTSALAQRSAEAALQRANDKVGDRFGGTRVGQCLAELVRSPRGAALRGAVVIIASDGWDTDPPDVLDHALARVHRRAERIVWLNPRAAAPGYVPLTGAMAAALPYCDVFASAHSLTTLRAVLTELVD